MFGDKRDYNYIGTRIVKFLPPPPMQNKALKEIHAILTVTLGEHAPPYATVKKKLGGPV
jgi:hypothetical protein